jgi:branched-chain amino acid transport system permease protein
VALAAGALFGGLFALVAQYVHGGYLVMLTIALLQVVASLVEALKDVTGGSDGLAVPAPSAFFGWGDLSNLVNRYWFLVGAVAVCLLGVWYVLRSPLGQSFQALRQNEARLRCLGYRVLTIKVAAWAISAGVAAYAGGLSAIEHQLVSASDVSFLTSALPLLVLCIAGTRGIVPAFVGSAVIVLVRDQLSPYVLGRQVLLLGCLFVVAAYLFPEGISVRALRQVPARVRGLGRRRQA